MSLATLRLLALTMLLGSIAFSAESVCSAAKSAVVQAFAPVALVLGLAAVDGLALDDELLLPQPATMAMAKAASANSATATRPLVLVTLIGTPFSGGAPPDAPR